MTSIIVVFPKVEEAKGIKNLLVRNGFSVTAVCTTGAQALGYLDDLNDGIVVCGYKMPDMMYADLFDCMPKGFEMLLMASAHAINEGVRENIITLTMPLKVHDLINTVDMMVQSMERARKKKRLRPKE